MADEKLKLFLKIIPNSSKDEVVCFSNERIKIKLKAPAENGKANKSLISFLAKILQITKSNIKLLTGSTSSLKTISVQVQSNTKERILQWVEELKEKDRKEK